MATRGNTYPHHTSPAEPELDHNVHLSGDTGIGAIDMIPDIDLRGLSTITVSTLRVDEHPLIPRGARTPVEHPSHAYAFQR